jgi:hypothetical protein
VGITLSDSEKAEALVGNLETQFQPVTNPPVPSFIEIVDVELTSYFLTAASEPKLTNPEVVEEVIRGLKFVNAPCPNRIPNRALIHLHSEWYPPWSRFSTCFFSPTTSLQCGSTLE